MNTNRLTPYEQELLQQSQTANTSASVVHDSLNIAQTLSGLVFVAIAIAWAVLCFSSFGILGALVVFAIGGIFIALIAAPLIGIIGVAVGLLAGVFGLIKRKS